jgi:restriction system protein
MRLADAEERYRAACTAWEQSKAATERRNRDAEEKYQRELADWEAKRKGWVEDQARRNAAIDEKEAAYRHCEAHVVSEACQSLLKASPYPYIVASRPEIALGGTFSEVAFSEYPDTFPRTFELACVRETRTIVVDYALPPKDAIPTVKGYKCVANRDEIQPVPVAQAWLNETYDSVLYQVTLRTIYELFRWDEAGALDSVVFNGWVNSIDKATGKDADACILTIQASKREFSEINLAQVDPKACFRKLKGISAAKLAGLSAVRPILEVSREDKRFIASRPVVDAIDSSTNLAAMDWEDFEQLIRDVFEKEFSADGGEVKITRASRDHGVDAVAFDPDPIRGGKIIIQAKRYTDTVSVSAVRDLYGTILNEGANKGILVTTADYGPDSYDFAKGKPITLLNGSELLYLLQKHGHKARIDLAEARFVVADKEGIKPGRHG